MIFIRRVACLTPDIQDKIFAMRILLIIIIFVHGVLHMPGFIKAFGMAELPQLPHPISRVHGVFWAIASILFITAAMLFLNYNKWWWLVSVIALIISQYLIISDWEDAGLGTALNIIILLVTIIGYGVWSFSNKYHSEVENLRDQNLKQSVAVLEQSDLAHLPKPVQQYIQNSGAVGQPRIRSFNVELAGAIRARNGNWMPFTSTQYNFIDQSARFFFMNAVKSNLPVAGFHCLKKGIAFMDIRLLSIFRVQHASGPAMNKADTVTFFNDMCCLAPATLIDPRITWRDEGNGKVRATFTSQDVSISADLFFNDRDELVNFVSKDRPALQNDGKFDQIPWSTPLSQYDDRLGYHLPRQADAVYQYPDGSFMYGRFEITKVSYNVA